MKSFLPVILVLFGGCDLRLDPDTLVRELRVLGARLGPDEAQGVADLDPTAERLRLRALVAAPTGPGRRVPAPRPLAYDWYFCLTTRSLLVPSTVDPACAKFGPADPDPRTNEALLYLGSGEVIEPPLPPLRQELLRRFAPLFMRMAGGDGGLPSGPIALQLPVVLRASAAGSRDPLDGETAFLFARLVFALPGQTVPPPNRNPALLGLWASADKPEREKEQSPAGPPLLPCPDSGPCTPHPVSRSAEVYLTALPLPGSVEEYRPLDESGRERVKETLRFSWFSTDGEFSEARTGGSSYTTRWKNEGDYAAPPEVRTVDLYVVVQDERGGAGWARYALQLTD